MEWLLVLTHVICFVGGAGCYWYFIVKRKYIKIETK